MNILFICKSCGRSEIACDLYAETHETKYAGLESPEHPVTAEEVEWADMIVVFSQNILLGVISKFPEAEKKDIVNLDISSWQDREDLCAKIQEGMDAVLRKG